MIITSPEEKQIPFKLMSLSELLREVEFHIWTMEFNIKADHIFERVLKVLGVSVQYLILFSANKNLSIDHDMSDCDKRVHN